MKPHMNYTKGQLIISLQKNSQVDITDIESMFGRF